MNDQTGFHPSTELLDEFIQGNLGVGLSIAISAHMELCQRCTQRSRELESKALASWLDIPEHEHTRDFSHLLDDIVSQPQEQSIEPEESASFDTQIQLPDRIVTLPRVLAKLVSPGLNWKQLRCGINQAAVDVDNQSQCGFDYFNPGAVSPDHSHFGSEVTLLLNGSFNDELGHYGASDFIVRGRADRHQPRSDEGCLCFVVLDSPLKFTRGIARLINPINYYKHRRARAQRQ